MSLFKLFIVIKSEDDVKSSSLLKELEKFFKTSAKANLTTSYCANNIQYIALSCVCDLLLDDSLTSDKLVSIIESNKGYYGNEDIKFIVYCKDRFLSFNINWRYDNNVRKCRLVNCCTFSRCILADLSHYLAKGSDLDVLSFIELLKEKSTAKSSYDYLGALSALVEFHLLSLPTSYAKHLLNMILEECNESE